MIPKSLLYKLVLNNIIVAEGSKASMKRAIKKHKGANSVFIGIGAPYSTLNQLWNKP
jgi:hypothetical protein